MTHYTYKSVHPRYVQVHSMISSPPARVSCSTFVDVLDTSDRCPNSRCWPLIESIFNLSLSQCLRRLRAAPVNPPSLVCQGRSRRLGRWILRDLAKPSLGIIPPPALQGTEGHIVPKDLRYVGSYNWTNAPTPTIIVPGQSGILANPS